MSKKKIPFGELKSIINKSGFFDQIFYLIKYSDARVADELPLEHFIKYGLYEDRQPNEYFDPIWYREYYQDIKESEVSPFIHYILHGLKENRKPNECFDPTWYKEYYEDVKNDDGSAFQHYFLYGRKEGRLQCKPKENRIIDVSIKKSKQLKLKNEQSSYEIIDKSGLFNKTYYLKTYVDVKETGIDPLKHYLENGWKEKRNPNEKFNTSYYLNQNLDVKKNGINPFLHYILYGQKEGRKIKEQGNHNLNYSDYIKLRDIKTNINIAIIVHINYIGLWEEILEKLKNITYNYTLYITTTTNLYKEICNLKMPNVKVKVYQYENIGMDVYPFIKVLKYLAEDNIDIFCKLHTKKGNDNTGKVWKDTLLEHTIGNNKIFAGIAKAFNEDETLKLVGSVYFYKNIEYLMGDNHLKLEETLSEMNLQNDAKTNGFFAGSMFWGRVKDYQILSDYVTDEYFRYEENSSNNDGKFTHTLEGLLGLVHKGDKKVALIYRGNNKDEYFLEKQIDNSGFKNNIGDTIFQINNLEYDYRVLKNFRFFNLDNYKRYFPHLNGHGINPFYHYLIIGRFFYNYNISTDILNVFDARKEKRILPLMHLALKGSLYNKNLSNNRDLNYEFSRLKVMINEAHLIDWDIEHKKQKSRCLVSIIIPVYGQAELTDNCLTSIVSADAGAEYEIIIVNNGQNKDDISSLDKWDKYPNIKIIHNKENLNFSLGCNLGFSRSIGEKVVFLNNDTTVTNNWLGNLISPLNDQNISITQPKLLYPDGTLQCMGLVFSNKSKLAYPLYQNVNIPEKIINKNRLFNAVTGACLAVRASDFAMVKGFDTHYINGQEDVDFCLQLNRLKNTKAMFVANSTVYHYEGKSKGRGTFVANNRKQFIEKWGKSIVEDDTQHYTIDGCNISQWNLDSQVFKDMQIENYIPVIDSFKYSIRNRDEVSLEIPKNFFISGTISLEKNKKTILISAHSISKQIFGGERSFLDMVKAIDKSKYNLIITIPNNNNKEYIKILSANSSAVYIVNYKVWNPKGINNKLVKLLENIITFNSIDLVYANTIMCREVLVAANNLNKVKVIHVRELIDKDEHLTNVISQDIKSIISELISSSDYLIANSFITKDMFSSNNIGVVYNQIETHHYKDIKNIVDVNNIKFTMISSNIPKKGIYDFFELAKLSRHIKNAHFVLIGPKNKFITELKESINQEKLTNITIAGYYESPLEAIKESNVVLSLSNFAESFGRTVGEALAGGRPVISYRYGAIPELVKHEENGYLVDYKDINGIVNYIDIFCKNPSKINEMGEKGRVMIDKISSPSIYKSTLNHLLEKSLNVVTLTKDIRLTIVIPIYNAYNDVINCIDSVLNTIVDFSVQLLLIDDCSPDKRIKPMLKKYNNLTNVEVIFNDKNIGYTNTVNKGINHAKLRDIILLNSDTITTFDWIESLRKIAYSSKEIGTVTAMSDNAGAFSFPKQGIPNPKPENMQYNNYANVILRKSHLILPVEVPTGSGFCFYIKHELIANIGLFDYEAFPRGYGEENDFCMRAVANGWKNVIAPNSLIFHIRTASFGNEKEKLVKEGVATVIQRYPEYNQVVQKAFGSKEMRNLRAVVQEARNDIVI